MSIQLLPTTNYPYTEYQVKFDNQAYTITTRWNETDESWYMDIVGVTNGVSYLGLKIVGGVGIIDPFAILELGSFYLIDLEEKYEDPDFDGFGDRYRIFYVPKDA